MMTHEWRSEDSLRESALSYSVGPRDGTQIYRFGGKCHLIGPTEGN